MEKRIQGFGGEMHTKFWWRNAYKVLVEKCIQSFRGEMHTKSSGKMHTKFWWRNA